jgi:hypothetical protein
MDLLNAVSTTVKESHGKPNPILIPFEKKNPRQNNPYSKRDNLISKDLVAPVNCPYRKKYNRGRGILASEKHPRCRF